jgi:glycosyltransferase involved in cell wall biosynthesis
MLWAFLRHVDRARLEPVVVFLQSGPFEGEVASLGLRTEVIRAGRLRQMSRTVAAVRQLAGLLERERPGLILNWTPKTQLYGASAATIAGMRDSVVWWQHGIPTRHWLDRAATVLPARAIGCSSHVSAAAQALLRPHRPTFVVHPGIERPSAIPPEETARLRRELDIPEGTLVVGIVGRLQPWKGQHRFIRAVHMLRDRGLAVHGLVVGGNAYGLSSDYPGYLRRLVHDLNLDSAITFAGQVDSPFAYLRLMDVFVNASEGEPFGIVVLEAMASALPIVAFADGGIPEIADEGSALLVPPRDDAALVEALVGLLEQPESRSRLAAGARERCLTLFRAERMAAELGARLETLAKDGAQIDG